jgi:hypothetical protein
VPGAPPEASARDLPDSYQKRTGGLAQDRSLAGMSRIQGEDTGCFPVAPEGPQQVKPRATPWGHAKDPPRSPERAKPHHSIPEIPFIKRDPMASEQRAEFVFERHLSVMLFLVFNILSHCIQVRLAYGKRAIPHLPLKVGILWAGGLHPLRTSLFDFLDDFAERLILGELEQCMNVIFDTTDHECWTISFPENSRLIGEQPIAMIRGNPGLVELRAIHEMNEIFHEGL